MTENGCCIYGIVHASPNLPADLTGLADAPVRLVTVGRIAAVISTMPMSGPRPIRKHIAAHHHVLRELNETRPNLPLAFGTTAVTEADIAEVLACHADALATQLDRLGGAVEMGLRVSWDVENLFTYLVERHPDLAIARERLEAEQASHAERLAAGEIFADILARERDANADIVRKALESIAREIEHGPLQSDADVVNVACLIDRHAVNRFEEEVHAVADQFAAEFVFSVSGPRQPNSFSPIELDLNFRRAA